jgi:hypothetical protein
LKYQRQRTKPNDIAYGLYLYFIGISYRNAAKALCEIVHRNHISVWKWIQKYKPKKISTKKKKLTDILLMKPRLKMVLNTHGFGLQQLSQNINKSFSRLTFLLKEQCLL